MVLMVWWRVVDIMCALDFAVWVHFFVCFFDGLRGGQKDDEEVFSETCQISSEEGKGQDTTSQKSKEATSEKLDFFRKTQVFPCRS